MIEITEAHRRHQTAVASYLATAASVPAEKWQQERAEGKWSAAGITLHLTLAFHALEQEVRGGAAMQRRLSGWKLLYARWIVLRKILADGPFPTGARAPRETRPSGDAPPRAEGLAQFQAAAAKFEQELLAASRSRPKTRLTHPYFGTVSLADALFISAKHVEHHRQQLPGI